MNGHKLKRVTRLVILPDYQGIGLGYKFLNFVAELYRMAGYRFRIVTSAKNLIMKLNKSQLWQCASFGFGRNNKDKEHYGNKRARINCKIASFEYLPKN